MKFCTLSSGSSGNCIYVESDRCKFIIDAGLSGRKIQLLLENIGVKASELDFILVTHEHTDHIAGVGVLSRRFNIPIIINERTLLAADKKIGKIKDENLLLFSTGSNIAIRDLNIKPIKIYHDAADPVGYVINDERNKISLLTDTGLVDEKIKEEIKNSDIYYMESNHDLEMLEYGPYPRELKRRIKSEFGHLSNYDAAQILADLLKGEGEKVVLGHLSLENNLPGLAFNTVYNYLKCLGLDGDSYSLKVAPRLYCSDLLEI